MKTAETIYNEHLQPTQKVAIIAMMEEYSECKSEELLINFLNWQVRNHRYHSLNNVDETVNIYLKKQSND